MRRLLALLTLAVLLCPAAFAETEDAGGFARSEEAELSSPIGAKLQYLLALRGDLLKAKKGAQNAPGGKNASGDRSDDEAEAQTLAALAPRVARADLFTGSIRFDSRPNTKLLARLEALGVEFFRYGDSDEPAGSRTVFPARIPFAALTALERGARGFGIAHIDCAWRPGAPPPLARSRPQVETEAAWEVTDGAGDPLSGEGVVIADFDTGVLFYHPAFFRESGESFDWLDVDLSGGLSPGDAVDLDGNELPGANEDLKYIEAGNTDHYGNSPGGYDTAFDFLYNDADSDGQRDYGPPAYGESDPTYGERLFIADDLDGDGILDPGEPLLALGDVMVRAIHNRDGSVRRRGVDLLQSETDYWGHGTQVTGIFGGGWAGRAMTGIAPGVECVHFDNDYISEPPFLVPIEAGLLWARDEGADVILIEDGEWAWEYLDGSSNVEIMLNELAADDGIVPVIPAGNLATGGMHTWFDGTDTAIAADGCHILWVDFLWFDSLKPQLELTPPGGSPIVLPYDGGTVYEQGYGIYALITISDRGTRRWDIRIATDPEGGNLDGSWDFHFSIAPGGGIHGFFYDDISGWTSASDWAVEVQTHTVTWPATADSAISVAAYQPADDGGINSYSGWGPRIDGRPDVDIAAPGSTVWSAHPFTPGNYTPFGGTSGAGPHVAGAVALLKQLMPDIDPGQCRAWLRAGAGQDEHTSDPNRWGAGKLRIYAAIAAALTNVADTPPSPELSLAAYPNPFNPATTLRFTLPTGAPATLRIFSASGRQVWSHALPAAEAGEREIRWGGVDDRGRALASGLYFVYLRQGDRVAATRVTLLK